MILTRKNVEFAKRVFVDRLGDPYDYGASYDPFDVKVGADCSGADGIFIGAALLGADGMSWTRQFSTESFPGPFAGFRQTTQADLLTGDYPIKVCIHHGGGGPNSHMQMQLDGIVMESNGDRGTCTAGRGAMDPASNYWNGWWVLDGSIAEDGTPRTEIPMTRRGLDYAGGRPAGATIKAAGYDFVVRYLSSGGSALPGKQLLPAEVADLHAAGVSIVSNWETTGTTALNGYAAGVVDAKAAAAEHAFLGGPDDRPIYFSLDWDEAPSQDAAVFDYFRGVASIIGLSRTGVYGAYWISKRLLDAGLVTYVWQTQAWSGGNSDPRFNLMQDNNAGYAYVSGVQCDIDYALTKDFGQWDHSPTSAPPTPGGFTMSDAQSVLNNEQGVDANGTPQWWNVVYGRARTVFGALIGNAQKGPWNEPYPAGITQLVDSSGAVLPPGGVWDHGAHAVLAAEAVSFRYLDSAGREVDLQSILIAFWEYLLETNPAAVTAAVAAASVKR